MPPINIIGILVAGVAGFLVGSVWYTVLGKQWVAAQGWSPTDMLGPDGKRKMPVGPMVTAFVGQFVVALMLAGLMGHIGAHTVAAGAVAGTLVWVGFVITPMIINHAFAHRKPMLTVIDGGHWLAVLVVEGIVLGYFG
jgi:hypothetical protein